MPERRIRVTIRLSITAALVAAVAACDFPYLPWATKKEGQRRAKVSRVRTDLRVLAVACEAYHVDNKQYPPFAIGAGSVNVVLGASVSSSTLPSFTPSLTTPVNYTLSVPRDVFAPAGGATYLFWSIVPDRPDPTGKIVGKDSPLSGEGFIILSAGPDGDYDLAGEWDVFNPGAVRPLERLRTGANKKGSAFTYDPTNGTVSNGDIWRTSSGGF